MRTPTRRRLICFDQAATSISTLKRRRSSASSLETMSGDDEDEGDEE
jgi:hypothetical protein